MAKCPGNLGTEAQAMGIVRDWAAHLVAHCVPHTVTLWHTVEHWNTAASFGQVWSPNFHLIKTWKVEEKHAALCAISLSDTLGTNQIVTVRVAIVMHKVIVHRLFTLPYIQLYMSKLIVSTVH